VNVNEAFRAYQRVQSELFDRKNASYGTSNIADSGISGVIVRMTDKFNRLKNLVNGAAENDESVADTLDDIANYATITRLMLAGHWPGFEPQERDINVPERPGQMMVNGPLQSPAKDGDVGHDLVCEEETICYPGRFTRIKTKTRVKCAPGTFGLLLGRSSAWAKLGLSVVPGVMDNGYTGFYEIVVFPVADDRPILVPAGTKVAQVIFLPMILPTIQHVDELPETERGSSGFGSSGLQVPATNGGTD
jgi:dUTP pyrophosphatase